MKRRQLLAAALRDRRKRQEALSRRMLSRRKSLGISQQQLADALEITQAAVSRYESGKRLPDRTTLLMIAAALKCTEADLC